MRARAAGGAWSEPRSGRGASRDHASVDAGEASRDHASVDAGEASRDHASVDAGDSEASRDHDARSLPRSGQGAGRRLGGLTQQGLIGYEGRGGGVAGCQTLELLDVEAQDQDNRG